MKSLSKSGKIKVATPTYFAILRRRKFMTTKYHQISFNDIFSDCQNKLIDDSPSFFSMLSEHVNLNEFIPPRFQSAFYLSVGRTHIYPLHDFHFSKVLIPYNPRNESSLK